MSAPSFTDLLPPAALAQAPHGRQDLCDLLGWMMQLQGTVRIAGLLDATPPPVTPRASDNPGEPLASGSFWRIDSIERTALSPLHDPFHGKGALLDAQGAFDWLQQQNAFGAVRTPAVLTSAAHAIGGALHRVVAERLVVVRAGMAELRRRLGARVRDLGATPTYLELLDRTLREATETRTQELFARIAPDLARRFEQLLDAELEGLPELPSVAHIESWYGPDGWLLDHVATCRVSVRAACGHEARALKGFVAAIDELTGAEERQSDD